MANFITTALGAMISPFTIDHAIWAVKLSTGQFYSERDMVRDALQREGGADGIYGTRPGKRPFDWTLDLVNTGDVHKVRELWLVCPPNPHSPLGNTAKLPITEPGTAFQFKVKHLSMGSAFPQFHQIIGRVTDKETGACDYFVWDHVLRGMSVPLTNNVYNFQSWRPDVGHIGPLALDVLGLRLGS